MGLIAAFQLEKDSITDLVEQINRINQRQASLCAEPTQEVYSGAGFLFNALITALLLNPVENSERLPCLTLTQLQVLLDQIEKNITSGTDAQQIRNVVCNAISEHLSGYYQPQVLLNLQTEGKLQLPKAIVDEIQDSFPVPL